MVNPSKIINEEFFAERSTPEPATGCLCWKRHINQGGYGTLKHKGKQRMAHRAMWEHKNGPIPDGMVVCHSCDNRRCINPEHLFLGTTQDNVDDKMAKGRFISNLGERSGTSKLTEEQIAAIRIDTRPQRVIARDFGVSQSNVSLIKAGSTWGHLPSLKDKRMTVQEFASLMAVPYNKFRHQLIRKQRGLRQSLEYCGVTL